MIEPEAVIAQARQWIGVPFLHQGRNRFGCDCTGLFVGLMLELGSSELADAAPAAWSRSGLELVPRLSEISREIDLQPAAIVVVRWPKALQPSHAALYTGSSIIHATQANGKVVEHAFGKQWMSRTDSIWALPMVAYQ